jgi:hypothetical protein
VKTYYVKTGQPGSGHLSRFHMQWKWSKRVIMPSHWRTTTFAWKPPPRRAREFCGSPFLQTMSRGFKPILRAGPPETSTRQFVKVVDNLTSQIPACAQGRIFEIQARKNSG